MPSTDRNKFKYPEDNPKPELWTDKAVADSAQTMCIGDKNHIDTEHRAPKKSDALKKLLG